MKDSLKSQSLTWACEGSDRQSSNRAVGKGVMTMYAGTCGVEGAGSADSFSETVLQRGGSKYLYTSSSEDQEAIEGEWKRIFLR